MEVETGWIQRKIAELEWLIRQPSTDERAQARAQRMLRELKLQLADLIRNPEAGDCD